MTNVAPFLWQNRGDLQASAHGPVLRTADQTVRQINALTVTILATGMRRDDGNQAMACLFTAATRTLQANIVYVEMCVLTDLGANGTRVSTSIAHPPRIDGALTPQ